MKSFFELPEYQIFHVLRSGESKPCGPFSPNQLVHLLNDNTLDRQDLVFYPGLSEWRPLNEVFDFHDRLANFESEGHDPAVLNQVFAELSQIANADEEFYDVVIQEKSILVSRKTDVAVLTDRGVWLGSVNRRGSFRGSRLESDEIRQVSARYPGRWDVGVLRFDLACGGLLEIKRVPRRQLRRFVALWRQLAAERWQRRWRRPLPPPLMLSET
jgi:hypothetical protein